MSAHAEMINGYAHAFSMASTTCCIIFYHLFANFHITTIIRLSGRQTEDLLTLALLNTLVCDVAGLKRLLCRVRFSQADYER